MSEILAELEKTNLAMKELQETVAVMDKKIMAKKTELEKKDREKQREMSAKSESLDELKNTSNAIIANIDDIVAKLSKVLE